MSVVRIPPGWDRISSAQVTPELVYLSRRDLLRQLGWTGVGIGVALGGCSREPAGASSAAAGAPFGTGPYGKVPRFWSEKWSQLFPASRNKAFLVRGEVTDEQLAAGYNNFYEFTTTKQRVKDLVDGFQTHPWQVNVTGEVEKKGSYDLDDLIRMGDLEERLYHLRCVEAWSANIPWTGFPLAQLIRELRPTSKARFVRFGTVLRPDEMPGQRNLTSYSWPYYEALTLEEAMNDLALLTFGMYGHPLNKQNGAPVRLVLPWKYGFKSIKSIVEIEFTQVRPRTFWSDASSEYGFWANVNPGFDHPRWSQATEVFLNTNERIPTQLYNGYGEQVAQLYDEKDRQYFY